MKHVERITEKRQALSDKIKKASDVLTDEQCGDLRVIGGSDEFVDRCREIVRAGAQPSYSHLSRSDLENELKAAKNAAQRLHDIIDGSTGGPAALWKYGLGQPLREFMQSIGNRLEEVEQEPRQGRGKNEAAREVGKALSRAFVAHGITPTQYSEGPFYLALAIVFDAINGLNRDMMPYKLQPIVNDVLGTK